MASADAAEFLKKKSNTGSMIQSSRRSISEGIAPAEARSASTTRVQLQALGLVEEAKKETGVWKKRAAGAAAISVVLLVAMLGTTVIGNEVSKDAKPDTEASELRTTDGQDNLVRVGVAESYAVLADLPSLGLDFLKAMNKITYHANGVLAVAKIEGYEWFSTSKMIIDLAPKGLAGVRRMIEVHERGAARTNDSCRVSCTSSTGEGRGAR